MRIWPGNRAGQLRLAGFLCALLVAAYFGHLQDYYFYFQYQPKEGDIIFQSLPHNDLVDAIEGITHSPYSHCGVVLKDDHDVWVVIEAIGNVHETPLLGWIKRGRCGDFTVYRLDPKYDSLIPKFKPFLAGPTTIITTCPMIRLPIVLAWHISRSKRLQEKK